MVQEVQMTEIDFARSMRTITTTKAPDAYPAPEPQFASAGMQLGTQINGKTAHWLVPGAGSTRVSSQPHLGPGVASRAAFDSNFRGRNPRARHSLDPLRRARRLRRHPRVPEIATPG